MPQVVSRAGHGRAAHQESNWKHHALTAKDDGRQPNRTPPSRPSSTRRRMSSQEDPALVFYGQGGEFFVGEGDASAEERIKSLLGESSQVSFPELLRCAHATTS